MYSMWILISALSSVSLCVCETCQWWVYPRNSSCVKGKISLAGLLPLRRMSYSTRVLCLIVAFYFRLDCEMIRCYWNAIIIILLLLLLLTKKVMWVTLTAFLNKKEKALTKWMLEAKIGVSGNRTAQMAHQLAWSLMGYLHDWYIYTVFFFKVTSISNTSLSDL